MALERTFAIIKPDAVQDGHIGEILTAIEQGGLKVVGLKLTRLTPVICQGFDHEHVGQGFYRVTVRFGFLENTDVPAALRDVRLAGQPIEMMKTSFFLSRQTLIAAKAPGMALWREKLFAWMLRNSTSAMEFFRLPINRVVELGSQVEI